jgi:hypothetical protein
MVVYLTLGAGGGLANFVLGVRRGHHRNNHRVRKGCLEIAGGALVALPLGVKGLHEGGLSILLAVLAFAVGVGWAGIVQSLRSRVTRVVEALLGETSKEQ